MVGREKSDERLPGGDRWVGGQGNHARLLVGQREKRIALGTGAAAAQLLTSEQADKEAGEDEAEENGDRYD